MVNTNKNPNYNRLWGIFKVPTGEENSNKLQGIDPVATNKKDFRYFSIIISLILIFGLFFFFSLSINLVSAEQLKVTQEHPFLINGEWIPASELKAGDNLTTIEGKNITIKNIRDFQTSQPFSVYNLEDDYGINNFVVGNNNIIVHNSGGLISSNMGSISSNNVEIKRLLAEYEALLGGGRVTPEVESKLSQIMNRMSLLKRQNEKLATLVVSDLRSLPSSVIHGGGESVIKLVDSEGSLFVIKEFHRLSPFGKSSYKHVLSFVSDLLNTGKPVNYFVKPLDILMEEGNIVVSRYSSLPILDDYISFIGSGREGLIANGVPINKIDIIEAFVRENPITPEQLQSARLALENKFISIESMPQGVYGARYNENHFFVEKVEDGKLVLQIIDIR